MAGPLKGLEGSVVALVEADRLLIQLNGAAGVYITIDAACVQFASNHSQ